MPKFINYSPEKDDGCAAAEDISHHDTLRNNNTSSKKLPSSNITNILPRMDRLGGPYGMYATVYGISTKVVHVAHPIPAKAVLADDQITSSSKPDRRSLISESLGAIKSPAYDHFKNFSGDGVFTADGSIWKAKRTSVLHCLLKGCTKDDSQESQRLEEEANIAADCFISNATTSNLNNGKALNVVPLLQRATIGLIYRFITHHDVDAGDQNKRDEQVGEIKNAGPKSYATTLSEGSDGSTTCTSETCSWTSISISPPTDTLKIDHNNVKNPFHDISSYLEAITNIRMIILAQSRSIWFLLPRWMYRTFSSMYREEEKQMVAIRQFARAACENAQLGSPLHMLRFKASHNPNMSREVKEGTEINKELLDEAITLLFAGQDTSAATLSWTLHLLSLYPNVQNKVAMEVHDVLKEFNCEKGNRISKKMIAKMPYLDAVVKESMRLYPVAPFVVRKIPHDLTIPIVDIGKSASSVTIPRDTFACIWIYGLHRNPKLWHRPDDFLPERWIDPSLQKLDDAQTKFKGTFMPFAFGPRNCVGQPLAQSILRIMLARIMNECQVIDPRMMKLENMYTKEGEEMFKYSLSLRKDMQAGFTVLPSGGVRLIIDKRDAHQ